jgi:hypothetical protein
VAPDDSTYALLSGDDAGDLELVALSPRGEPRWTKPITPYTEARPIVVADATGHTSKGRLPDPGDPASPVSAIFHFDAETGEQRTLMTKHRLLGAAPAGAYTFSPGDGSAGTLHQLDRTRNIILSRTLAVNGDLMARWRRRTAIR